MLRIDADQQHPHRIWRSFGELLGRSRTPLADVDAVDLDLFLDDKVSNIRAVTDDSDPPTFRKASVGCVLRIFAPVTVADVQNLMRSLPDK